MFQQIDFGSNPNIESIGISLLASHLHCCRFLNSINLRFVNMGPQGAAILAQALPEVEHLTYLDISYNNLGGEGCESLTKHAIPYCSKLSYFDISQNGIGISGGISLAKVLPDSPHLTYLNLRYNHIGGSGAESLSKALLRGCFKLSVIDVGKNDIGPDGGLALVNTCHQRWRERRVVTQLFDLEYNPIGSTTYYALSKLNKHYNDVNVSHPFEYKDKTERERGFSESGRSAGDDNDDYGSDFTKYESAKISAKAIKISSSSSNHNNNDNPTTTLSAFYPREGISTTRSPPIDHPMQSMQNMQRRQTITTAPTTLTHESGLGFPYSLLSASSTVSTVSTHLMKETTDATLSSSLPSTSPSNFTSTSTLNSDSISTNNPTSNPNSPLLNSNTLFHDPTIPTVTSSSSSPSELDFQEFLEKNLDGEFELISSSSTPSYSFSSKSASVVETLGSTTNFDNNSNNTYDNLSQQFRQQYNLRDINLEHLDHESNRSQMNRDHQQTMQTTASSVLTFLPTSITTPPLQPPSFDSLHAIQEKIGAMSNWDISSRRESNSFISIGLTRTYSL